ncbi:hypothetical protein HPB48_024052 [Haemaphysalis longicornis]|uniref:Elongation of very long chain fatty acids protein n=1 Tax=Haemaphysalis longicornis TaxID=44386 RepID=A0A9J6H7U1_HAELO|nr:hypothetical protein HPB48_024052 [Haemaphysalis longicornis]
MASSSAPTGTYDGGLFSIMRDPRTAHWTFPGNKQLLAVILISYVYVVKIGGPRFMKNRKPFDGIKPLIALYNLYMVLCSLWFVSAVLSRTYLGGGYSLICQGIDYNAKGESTMELLSLMWWYTIVRIGDFLDTFFFVLRKKDSHVSFLHVTHHVLVVFNLWFALTYGPDGQAALAIVVNASVHAIMYSYYFLSLLGPAVQKHLWWKRYLTQLQLVQFIVLSLHGCVPFVIDCGYPRIHGIVILWQYFMFFGLFMRFYRSSYKGKASPAVASAEVKSKEH